MNQIAYKYFEGIDLMEIEGVNDATIMTIISEIGLNGNERPRCKQTGYQKSANC